MKKDILKLFLFIFSLLFIFPNITFGATIKSKADGDWNDGSTWDGNIVPTSSDDVIIQHNVTVNGNFSVNKLNLSNTHTTTCNLTINNFNSLTVITTLEAISYNYSRDVDIQVIDNAILTVNGNATFTRESANQQIEKLRVYISGAAKAYFKGDFTYTYFNSSPLENNNEIQIEGTGIFDISGNTYINMHGGKTLDFEASSSAQLYFRSGFYLNKSNGDAFNISAAGSSNLQFLNYVSIINSGGTNGAAISSTSGGSIVMNGDLNLQSVGTSGQVVLMADGTNSKIEVKGTIEFNANNSGKVGITLTNSGSFFLGGNLNRLTSFGFLNMDSSSIFHFNGTSSQTIPDNNLSGSGVDELIFTQVSFENTSGQPTVLADTLFISDSIDVSNGILQTSTSSPLILERDAKISGGSASAYINGPVVKRGSTNGNDLFLPLGSSSTYAPVTLSSISNADAELTAQYFSEPPPFGNDVNNFESGIEQISQGGYWKVEKNASTGNLNYTLQWTNAESMGIEDLSTLIVAGLDGSTWKDFGQESTTGGVGSGVSGSITNAFSEPPPFGVEFLTIGNVSSAKLPVELIKFEAIQKDEKVQLFWETASEDNSSHFVVERSIDGINFERLTSINSKGNTTQTTNYKYKDSTPNEGWNYYRLKIVDLDESFEYSGVEVIKLEINSDLKIFPNPIKDYIQLEGSEWGNEDVLMEIFDKNGQLIFIDKIQFEEGKFQMQTDIMNIDERGTYFIRISGRLNTRVLKFIKVE